MLHEGESQRRDGRYRYRYVSWDGKTKEIYSWRLDNHDLTPPGKKHTESIREMKKRIQADQFDKVATNGGNMSVYDLAEKYVATKIGVRVNTRMNYQTVLNFLKNDSFGKKRIDTVRKSDAKLWLIKLQQEQGKSYSQIHNIRGILRPAFQLAFDDDLIRKNPFEFELVTVLVNDSVRREAVTRDVERKFLKFVQEDSHFSRYYEGIYILFKTGMRISEFCGLTLSDLDFKNHSINVDHQLQKRAAVGYYIEETKTESGKRVLPMTPDVEECFKRIVCNRKPPKTEPMIDGRTGFLYFDKDGSVVYSLHWEHYFKHIVQKYNKIYKVQIPKITPHVCRHTYCSNMAKAGMNPKTLQYLMGHSDISVTLNTYTHVNFDDAKKELKNIKIV
ncbi:MAG: tyrosine-type recombinase/integrase [Butyrivibrio sp.]|nr:tyrosine-type recombinase/integrase [Butyrivibrio sp.]